MILRIKVVRDTFKQRLTESENLNISDVSDSEIIKEEFNPMDGIDNFLNNPTMIALATAWLLMGKYKVDNLKSWKNDFLDYCNLMGYTIDPLISLENENTHISHNLCIIIYRHILMGFKGPKIISIGITWTFSRICYHIFVFYRIQLLER